MEVGLLVAFAKKEGHEEVNEIDQKHDESGVEKELLVEFVHYLLVVIVSNLVLVSVRERITLRLIVRREEDEL